MYILFIQHIIVIKLKYDKAHDYYLDTSMNNADIKRYMNYLWINGFTIMNIMLKYLYEGVCNFSLYC